MWTDNIFGSVTVTTNKGKICLHHTKENIKISPLIPFNTYVYKLILTHK